MDDTAFDLLTEQQLRARKTIKWNHFGSDVLPLWIAEMDFPTAPAVLDSIRRCVANEEFGYPAFREDTLARATADWWRRYCPGAGILLPPTPVSSRRWRG